MPTRKGVKLTIGTDCSGIEAPIAALQRMKIPHRHVWSCEIDRFARESIVANYAPETIYEDITKRNHSKLPHVDLYVCGFPCQPFSMMGDRKGMGNTRSSIIGEMLDTIGAVKPKVFILENVKSFLYLQQGQAYKYLMQHLSNIDGGIYNVKVMVLNSRDYGIPQNRERVFFVGINKSFRSNEIGIPPARPMKPLDKLLIDHTVQNIPLFPSTKWQLLTKRGIDIDQLRGNYVVSRNRFPYVMKDVTPTITTNNNIYLVKYKRSLYPVEYLMLQGFPKTFKIVVSKCQIFKQAGNSITVDVLVALFKEIFLN